MTSSSPESLHRTSPHRILVADDDGHIREVLRFALERAGYDVALAEDGRAAWELFEQALREPSPPVSAFDLVVLDILMPGLDGLDLCRRIREKSRIPLIFVSSKDEELDRILGLELGADDYVTKPFSPRELVARVKAALRRCDEVRELLENHAQRPSTQLGSTAKPAKHEQTTWSHGPLCLDAGRHECSVGEHLVVLTVSEFALLKAVLQSGGRVLTRRQLVETAYGDAHFLSDRTVDSHIRRIRKKLADAGHQCVETVYGVGYRLAELR